MTCPALRPRRDRRARPLPRVDVAFRHIDGVGSHDTLISRLNHTARTLAVYASQGRPPPRKTRFRLAGHPFRAGLEPAGSHRKVSGPPSSFPRLSLAH